MVEDGERLHEQQLRAFLARQERRFEQGLEHFRDVSAKMPTRNLIMLASKSLFDLALAHENPSRTALCAEAVLRSAADELRGRRQYASAANFDDKAD